MRDQLSRRLVKLELGQLAGNRAYLDESEFLFVHVPDDCIESRQLAALEATATSLGKILIKLSGPAAASMPLYVLTPLNLLPDEVLDDQINTLRARLSGESSNTTENLHGQSAQ